MQYLPLSCSTVRSLFPCAFSLLFLKPAFPLCGLQGNFSSFCGVGKSEASSEQINGFFLLQSQGVSVTVRLFVIISLWMLKPRQLLVVSIAFGKSLCIRIDLLSLIVSYLSIKVFWRSSDFSHRNTVPIKIVKYLG